MKISPVQSSLMKDYSKCSKQEKAIKGSQALNSNSFLSSYSKYYYLMNFTARVDKGLERFVSVNEEFMPKTTREFIESLSFEQRRNLTPLQAQYASFEMLSICDSAQDVKEVYPNEPLFENLIDVQDSRATRGLLYDVRLMKKDIEESGETILSNGDELTIYLLKKIFLESKTISEINDDLDKDLNPVFQKEDKNYIASSTLKALGIKFPEPEYLTSLRYTKDGYSDLVGGHISEAWASKTDEEKELIVNSREQRTLTDSQRLIRSITAKENWEKLSPQEKTERIEAMHSGGEEQRLIMYSAWNKLPEVRKALAMYLMQNNFYNPQSIIYIEQTYNSAMKIIMEKFWQENEKAARELSLAVDEAQFEYKQACADDKKEQYIEEVLATRDKIKTEIRKEVKETLKVSNKQEKLEPVEKYRKLFAAFLPESMLNAQCEKLKLLPKSEVSFYINYCMGAKIKDNEEERINQIDYLIAPTTMMDSTLFVTSVICEFEKCLAPFKKPTGETFMPIFPADISLRVSDVARIYFDAKKNGYQNAKVINKRVSYQTTDSFVNDMPSKHIIDNNPDIKFDKKLLNSCTYHFSRQPDFEAIKNMYDFYALQINIDKEAAVAFNNESLRQGGSYFNYINGPVINEFFNPNSLRFSKSNTIRGLGLVMWQHPDKVVGDYAYSKCLKDTGYEQEFINFFKKD